MRLKTYIICNMETRNIKKNENHKPMTNNSYESMRKAYP